jgi:hypothetical protein
VKARACPLPVVLEAEDALCCVHMPRSIGLIGVPSSAGAHWPGQEKAPGALRAVGLIGRLEDAGLRVDDHGDPPRVRFRPDKRQRHQQNLSAVIEVTSQVADRTEATLRADQVPLVLGGDCTSSSAYWPVVCGVSTMGCWVSSTSRGMWTSTPHSRVPRASWIRWGGPHGRGGGNGRGA